MKKPNFWFGKYYLYDYLVKKEFDNKQIILKKCFDKKEAKLYFKHYIKTSTSTNWCFKLIIQKYKNGVFVKNIKIKEIKK